MPPRTPQKKHPSKSLTLDPSDFQTPSKPAADSTQTKYESSDPNQHRETFDLNEPYCDELEHEGDGGGGGGGGSYSQVKQEIEVREVREVEDRNRINNNSNNNEKNEIHPEEVPANRERRKQKEYEVFVGGLDRDAVEEDLEKVFKKMGEIVEVRLVKNKFSQKNKGFAFVRFATIEQAKRAAAELNYTQVRGKVCEVTRNNDNETLHLGNICPTWTTETLVEKLRPYELENLEDVHLIEDPKDRRRNRGYAFLNFNNHMDAVAACNKLQKGSLYLGTNVRADIAFAKSAVEPDEETMSQVKSIFIDGLPPSWDEEQVQQQFQKFGVIDNVQLARNMPSAKRRDFGFISFRTREAALSCIDTVNRDGIGEGTQKISVRATLRKPLQRRMSSGPGGYRGYSSDHYDRWDARSGGVGRSYSNREYRTYEPLGRGEGRGRRISGYSRYSGRGDASRRDVYDSELPPAEKYGGYSRYSTRDAFETESSPVEEYGSQFRKGVVRQVPTTSHSRPRGAYVESGSSSRRSSRNYEDFPPSYTRVSTHEQYDDDDGYGLQYEYYENNSPDMYDYPAPSRMKRPYSAVDDEPLVSRSLARRSRSGERDMDVYPIRGVSSYEEYARSMPDTHYGYDSAGYESRYSSGRGAPRSYDY